MIHAAHAVGHLYLTGSWRRRRLQGVIQSQGKAVGLRKLRAPRRDRESLPIHLPRRISSRYYWLTRADQAADDMAVENHVAVNHNQVGELRLAQERIGKVVSRYRYIA